MAENESDGLGFEGWMQRFEQQFGADREEFDLDQPMDDVQKLRWLNSIDHRYMMALPRARPGQANEALVQDIQQIIADYERVLQLEPPKTPIYDAPGVQLKLADAHHLLAGSYESLQDPDYEQARRHYSLARDMYAELGQHQQVQREQERLENLEFLEDQDVDKEIVRLRGKLDSLATDSFEYADVLIDLGGLYRNNGDDYEAEQLFLQAKAILDNEGGDIEGQDLAASMVQSLLAMSEGAESDAASLQRTMRVRDMYLLIYTGLSRIYKSSDPELAAKYQQLAAQRDSREQNDDFSQAMLQAMDTELQGLFYPDEVADKSGRQDDDPAYAVPEQTNEQAFAEQQRLQQDRRAAIERERESQAQASWSEKVAAESDNKPKKKASFFGNIINKGRCLVGAHKGEWIFDQPGQCTQVRVCELCDTVDVRTAHGWSDWSYQFSDSCHALRDCQRCGEQDYELRHQWQTWSYLSANDCTQRKSCARCREYSEESRIVHSWSEWSIDHSNQVRRRRCHRCSQSETERIELPQAESGKSLDGVWMTGDGLPVQFRQTGNQVVFKGVNQYGAVVVDGQGTISGNQLHLLFSYYDGRVYDEATALMQIAADGRRMEGMVQYRRSGVRQMMGLVKQS